MLPSKITAGDSLSFTIESFRDPQGRSICPPDWTLSLALRGNTINKDYSADSTWKFSIPSSETTSFIPGTTYFQLVATNGAERVSHSQGSLEVLQNLSALTGTADLKTQNRRDLEAVRALIRQLVVTGGVAEYRIGTRSARKYELADLRALESQLVWRVADEEKEERIKKGLGNPRDFFVRFKK